MSAKKKKLKVRDSGNSVEARTLLGAILGHIARDLGIDEAEALSKALVTDDRYWAGLRAVGEDPEGLI